MRKLLALYFILGASASVAQNKTIDSLQQALKDFDAKKLKLHKNLLPNESDTAKVDILNNLSRQFWLVSEYATGQKYANEALAIAQQVGYKRGIANSYNAFGMIYKNQGNFAEALKNYYASLKIREEIGDKKGIAASYNNIGIVYWRQDNYPEALKNYYASLKIKEETGDKTGLASTYNNIGLVNSDQDDLPEALKNYSASLKIYQEIGDNFGLATSYNNIGLVYKEQGNYPEALKNYSAALKIREQNGEKNGIAMTYYNIGNIHHAQGNYVEALRNDLAALKIREEIGDKEGIAFSSINIGFTKIKMHAAREGKDWLMKALQFAKETDAILVFRNVYEGLAQADSALGNFKGAHENHKLAVFYRDSLHNEEATKKSVQIQMQYEFDKKEATVRAEQDKKDAVALKEMQKQKLIRNGLTGGFVIVLLFAGVFFTQRNRIKQGKKRSDELLLNILPSEVAEELKVKGRTEAKHFDEVSVMFTDFKDFTQTSENLSPSELVELINQCFSEFDKIISKYGLEKIKTIGDSYMCAGGLPMPNKTNAADIVNAAIDICEFMKQKNQKDTLAGQPIFEIRIGCHTGPVVAGIVGIKKFAYDIWGDTVNIASRMESSGEVGKVNISGATFELVKDKFSCRHRGKVQAKNKGEIDMYFVEQA